MHRLLIVLFFFCFCQISFCQVKEADSADYKMAVTRAERIYQQARGLQLALYNGPNHNGYPASIKGLAYFISENWQKGNVFYDGMLYENVSLKFDLVTNEVIVLHPNGFQVILYTPKVQYFTLADQRFIYLVQSNSQPLVTGFYHELAKGPMTILVKRQERIIESVNGLIIEKSFETNNQYYIVKEGRPLLIKSLEDILQYTGNKRKIIRKELRNNSLNFRKNKEAAVTLIAVTYNQDK
jgi:hypothetical protein